ncbi:hypothetical protein V8F33_000565 [Rhypophila sp. PSN 637]
MDALDDAAPFMSWRISSPPGNKATIVRINGDYLRRLGLTKSSAQREGRPPLPCDGGLEALFFALLSGLSFIQLSNSQRLACAVKFIFISIVSAYKRQSVSGLTAVTIKNIVWRSASTGVLRIFRNLFFSPPRPSIRLSDLLLSPWMIYAFTVESQSQMPNTSLQTHIVMLYRWMAGKANDLAIRRSQSDQQHQRLNLYILAALR